MCTISICHYGIVLGPLLYSLHTTPFLSVIPKYLGVRCNFFADDTQIYISFSPKLTFVFSVIELCIRDIFSRMFGKLSVNPNKMDYLHFNPKHVQIPHCNINIDTNIIMPNDLAKNLCVIFQSDVSMDNHMAAIVKSCFLQLRNFHRIRPFISKTATITLANAFVYSYLDYCNSLFYVP